METVICKVCGKEIPKYGSTQVGEDSGVFVCEECYEKECVECSRCGVSMFKDEARNTYFGHLCECCYDDLFG